MKEYNFKKIESKWRKKWKEDEIYKTKESSNKPKCYVLDMFPYPSGDGLHVGHPKGYIATDVYSRFKKMNGFNILHPMGWDAFGLPAENYAIKNKVHPKVAVKKNIEVFKKQLEKIGFNYDWGREINTTDSKYYKWTQWVFLQMFKKGLAYESHEPINWCPSCKTGLANEDLEDGKCERCGSEIEQKPMRQWVLKITDYADRMLEDLDGLDWPESIKLSQKNWIGKSEGTIVKFKIQNSKSETNTKTEIQKLEVFTTRVDTIFGCTYCVVAPEHPLIKNNELGIRNYEEVEKYIKKTKNKSEIERTAEDKEKTGVLLRGVNVVNPFNGEELPVYVADYVLGNYGTGAVMAVPAHDERDFEFAKKYGLSIKPSILKNHDKSLSFIMGMDEVSDDIFKKNDVEIIKKTEEGFLKVLIPFVKLNEYKNLIRKKMAVGFWNEFSTKNGFYFIFKHKDGKLEEFELNSKTNDIIDKYGMIFNNEEPNRPALDVYTWLAENDFYKNILIHTDDGILINSAEFTGLTSSEARQKMIAWLEKKELGGKKINYKLRDWVFSRQRYWGEPIPIIHCEKCGVVPVPEKDLPVELPNVKSYEPTGTGESPLAGIDKWVNTPCPKCGRKGKRETNTMPQWAGSSWYYLRYIDTGNDKNLVNKKKDKYWSPVDMYVGGAEHATRHLIYARFWHKFLYDIGVVNYKEPFKKLQNVGLINAEDGRKMSKRWKNVINPDDVIAEFGADAFRLYEMFMGPFDQSIAWSTNGIKGTKRFLDKIWKLTERVLDKSGTISHTKQSLKKENANLDSLINKTIKKVTEDVDSFKFNTTISALMILVNALEKESSLLITDYKLLIILLAPFAPHLTDELWEALGNKKSIYLEPWPTYDLKKIKEDSFEMVVQINGKIRDRFVIETDRTEEEITSLTLQRENVTKHINNSKPKKIIYIKNKLINIVV